MKKLMLGVLTTTVSTFIWAGTMGMAETFNPSPYIKLGSGGSYSIASHIYADSAYWDLSPQGYNAQLGQTALYSAAFGYNFTPILSADIEYTYRPSYTYAKYQTSSASGTTNFAGAKTRYFDLQSNSLMANVYLHGKGISDRLNIDLSRGFFMEPFVGGGLGVAFNTVTNFHSISVTKPAGASGPVVSMLADQLRTNIAWQLSVGLNVYNDSNFTLGAGYRYYNGEKYSSNNYLTDWQTYATPWKGGIQANEFFINLSYKLFA